MLFASRVFETTNCRVGKLFADHVFVRSLISRVKKLFAGHELRPLICRVEKLFVSRMFGRPLIYRVEELSAGWICDTPNL